MSDIVTLRSNLRASYLKIDPNGKIWDDNTLDYYINRGYTRFQQDTGFDIPECEGVYTLNTVGGQQEYTEPSDLVKITGFFDNSNDLKLTNKKTAVRLQGSQSRPSQYYRYGGKIGLYPTPNSAYALDLIYSKKLPAVSVVQDSLLTIDQEDAVILYACYLMFVSVEKNDKASIVLSQYESAKDSLFGQALYDSEDIRFGIQMDSGYSDVNSVTP